MEMRKILLAGVASTLAFAAPAWAEFPERPLLMVVGFAPGGLGDIVSRLLAGAISERRGQRVVVENRTGANGMIALEAVARAKPDGYTLINCGTGQMTVSPELPGLKLPIDIARDIAPVANVVRNSWALAVSAKAPYRNVAELLAAARAKPGAMTYGSAGVGSLQHLAVEWLKREAGVDVLAITYRGIGPAVIELQAGRLDLVLTSLGDVSRQVQQGQLRLLAVADDVGSPLFPDAPQIAATVPGYTLTGWNGVCGPRNLPANVIRWWETAIAEALKDEAFKQRVVQLGMIPGFENAEQFAKTIESNRRRWREVIRTANVRAE